MKPVRYTWSRWAPNPVEHVADESIWGQPICGRHLAPERQTFGGAPTGVVPVCGRCERKLKKMQHDQPKDFVQGMHEADAETQERQLLLRLEEIKRVLPAEVRYRILDQLNGVASDLFGDEFDQLHG